MLGFLAIAFLTLPTAFECVRACDVARAGAYGGACDRETTGTYGTYGQATGGYGATHRDGSYAASNTGLQQVRRALQARPMRAEPSNARNPADSNRDGSSDLA